MLSSIRPVSVFSLIGDPSDDSDLWSSPIAPQSQCEAPGVSYSEDKMNIGTVQQSSSTPSHVSPPSIISEKLGYSESPLVHPLSPPDITTGMTVMTTPTLLSHKVHVQAATKDIDAMDVNPSYVSLSLPTIHPGTTVSPNILLISALCLYIAPTKIGLNDDPYTLHLPMTIDPFNDIYYAVYVPAHSANSLSMAIATKMGIDPTSIIRTTIINKHSLRFALDDEVAREMLEKQDMRVAVRDIEFQAEYSSDMIVEKRFGLELFLAF